MLGNVKHVNLRSLIKVYNEQAQALLTKSGNGTSQLEVLLHEHIKVLKPPVRRQEDVGGWGTTPSIGW